MILFVIWVMNMVVEGMVMGWKFLLKNLILGVFEFEYR